KFKVSLPSVLGQAERYARDIDPKTYELPEGNPWEDFRVPLVYVANGRPYLKQIEDESGIHMRDLRDPTNKRAVLDGWPSPEGLEALLASNPKEADEKLADSPVDLPGLRRYQIRAINEVEKAIAEGDREILLAMATGTGKTRTCLSLVYRLIKAHRFRRILFLVDRTKLGEQAADAFKEVKLEQLQPFSEIYNVQELGDIQPAKETRVQIATVQAMVKRVLSPGDDHPPPVDQYDCVVIDECHRGYNLDSEMAEHELTFRSEADFISKYTRVLDHFHAVKIGLTATPAQHTETIFGAPVFTYSYREAVTDGFLCDHEPPIRFVTKLAKNGIKWKKGETIQTYNPKTAEVESVSAPDEVLKNVEEFNKQVITKPFNKVICEELATYLDPEDPGKTLVFCANDRHADLFVKVLKDALDDLFGPQRDDLVKKITGSSVAADSFVYPRFKNEANPRIAVTVDLLTTGIDIPEITNLVFVRRVKSRILYEQMLGRATRLRPDLFGPGENKEFFRIFDAVDLYASLEKFSTMKPVVTNPTATIRELAGFLKESMAEDPEASDFPFHDELVARIRRKRSRIEKAADELATKFDGLTPDQFIDALSASASEAVDLLDAHPALADWLDSLPTGKQHRLLISDHKDELLVTESGYGEGKEKPEDYLERFSQWIAENKSTNESLTLVLTQPASLKRSDLKKLALEMAEHQFLEPHLREAWHEVKHEDCAARLIGYIRAQALGSPLIPFQDRVDTAVAKLLQDDRFQWSKPRRQWLERIAKQVKKEQIVDQSSLQQDAFNSAGGYNRINKIFKGQLDDMLTELHTHIWQDDEVA
ncbi:MAG: type I restriction-modification system endonuclease, partial [Verrucomicrobiales bacterium]|nr:type I restriction-modification system endonuclease [Verrucomicrobiales bacterium]